MLLLPQTEAEQAFVDAVVVPDIVASVSASTANGAPSFEDWLAMLLDTGGFPGIDVLMRRYEKLFAVAGGST